MKLLHPGERFDGLEIVRPLGEGGFAEVYEATDSQTGRVVAVKVLKASPRTGDVDPRMRARFAREAEAVSRLRSPHIVEFVRAGQLPDGEPYVAFEYAPGLDLSELLAEGLPPVDAVEDLLRQLLRALDEAHTAGVLHRDIKPSNIKVQTSLDGRMTAKLLDFGIARSTNEGHPSLTATGELIGTPRYMSPEQLTSRPLTAASDIYSLGMVVFEALVGPEALPGPQLGAQLDRLASGHVFSAASLSRMPPHLVNVVQRMTARKPEERYATAAAALRALDGVGPALPEVVVAREEEQGRGTAAALVLVSVLIIALVIGVISGSEPEPTRLEPSRDLKGFVKPPDTGSVALVHDTGPVPHDAAAPADVGRPPWWEGLKSGCGTPAPDRHVLGSRTILPRRFDNETPVGLMIVLHTDFHDTAMIVGKARLAKASKKHGFIAVAPYDGFEDINDLLKGTQAALSWRGDGEGAALGALVRRAYQRYCIDPSRIFVFAQGDGVRAALAATCEEWLTAAVMFGFGIPEDIERQNWCEQPRPVLWFHPRHSEVTLTDGGKNCRGEWQVGLDATRAMWLERNRCSAEARTTISSKQGRCRAFECEVPFELCSVEGGVALPGQPTWHPRDRILFPDFDCPPEKAGSFDVMGTAWRFVLENGGPAE